MDDDERMEMLRRLLDQQHMIRTVVEAAGLQAELAKAAGHPALAFSIYFLMESLHSYSVELSKFVKEYIGEE